MNWHQAMDQSCRNCRFNIAATCRGGERITTLFISSSTGTNAITGINGYSSHGWPSTIDSDWCGKWQPNFTEDKLEPTRV